MKRWTIITTLFLIILSLHFSCRKTQNYSIIPELKYKDFLLHDTTDILGNKGLVGKISFEFVDGDGDIGSLQPKDSLSSNDSSYYNMFFTLWAVVNGEIIKPDLKQPLNYRIPYIQPESQDPTVKGIIKVDFLYFSFPYDTISYDFFIRDRKMHDSNIESSPFFILPAVE